MKFKTTRKEIINSISASALFSAGYCAIAFLLYFENPIAYTCGVYGWNFDLYNIDNKYYITTGYRNMAGKPLNSREYEESAQKIVEDHTIPYDKKKELVKKLLIDCLKFNSDSGCNVR